ncbi:MAG: hypothetical protein SWE60_14305, partial [Thermodesulfobacteriota bacterium]|nr:hypothetical protein [Thermodesulfobacteriota bacterium]
FVFKGQAAGNMKTHLPGPNDYNLHGRHSRCQKALYATSHTITVLSSQSPLPVPRKALAGRNLSIRF